MNPSQSNKNAAELSLKSRVIKSGGWVFGGKVAGQGLSLLRMIILARLLAPRDFGLFGIVMLALATMRTFTNTGFDQALIQRQDETEGHLDTAWTIQILRGFVLAGAVFLAAPLLASFFNEPLATPMLRVVCLVEGLCRGHWIVKSEWHILCQELAS